MNLLVTGSSGFIGSAVCRLLLENGHDVQGVDNLNDAYDPSLKHWRTEALHDFDRFQLKVTDVADRGAAGQLFESGGFDAVINLAARAGVRQSQADPWVYYETNVVGTLNLLEQCVANGVDRFVLASTSSVYGLEPPPFSEDAACNTPLSPYAASKKAAEELCHSYTSMYGLGTVALRFFTVYGPAGRPDMSIFRFIRWIAEGEELMLFGDGSQKRSFTYVTDIARGVLDSLSAPDGHSVINLGSDQTIELSAVIDEIETTVGRRARIRRQDANSLDMHTTWADISKAREVLGWEPAVSMPEGVARTVEWYMQNRERARSIQIPE